MSFDCLRSFRGAAEGEDVSGAGVCVAGEVSTTGRSARLGRGVDIEAAFVEGEALPLPHAPDQAPKLAQARRPAMSTDQVR
ncbi:hypothetical protein ACIBI9_40170 [Nonomuraea sp. NPDC050451]|uniref:hypothetical protein n=1 Tax=Nonomuraea sp. NPDC050451 TaxID=3364364 RepID=UPI0037A05C18